ncbi:MAG: L-threonylcarbamoyladenylate synthase [Pseudomonadota bacterium]
MTRIVSYTSDSIKEAADILKSGGLVGMPTETVYGLAANALDGKAVAGIFEAKNRPQFNPLIVHVPNAQEAEKYVVFDDRARAIANEFWPGPLTLILRRKDNCPISDLASAGLDTLAVRVPANEAAQELLKVCGLPLAAPSANASGQPSATSPKHVADSLGDAVDIILAAGTCEVGLESTVLDLSGDEPVILRPGAITAEDFKSILGDVDYDFGDHDKPKSPGQLLKHYAPSIPVRLKAVDVEKDEALLAFGSIKFMGIREGGSAIDLPDHQIRNLSESGDLHEAAAHLFAYLRELDNSGFKGIAVMDVPDEGLGVAINDRLDRAAAG